MENLVAHIMLILLAFVYFLLALEEACVGFYNFWGARRSEVRLTIGTVAILSKLVCCILSFFPRIEVWT